MRIEQERARTVCARRMTSAERVMWITADRVFYAGLLGTPSTRHYGAFALYVALDSAIHIKMGTGTWQMGDVAIVPPYTSHHVACDGRHIVGIMIEPESVDVNRLPDWLRMGCGVIAAERFRSRVLRTHRALLRNGHQVDSPMLNFDALVFGQHLPAREVDPRIAQVINYIRAHPSSRALALDCAAQVHLSFYRFLHLFKREAGASFRSFRAWKRARSLLHYVANQRATLTHVALEAGYPDATHFSHSIRQVYGLQPKDIFAGSRKLRVIGSVVSANQYA